jgi:hypothetical protein
VSQGPDSLDKVDKPDRLDAALILSWAQDEDVERCTKWVARPGGGATIGCIEEGQDQGVMRHR